MRETSLIFQILVPILILWIATQRFRRKSTQIEDALHSQPQEEVLNQMLLKNPNDPLTHYYKAYRLWQEGDVDEAIAYIKYHEKALKNSAPMYTLLAEIYYEDSQVDKAIENYVKSVSLSPTSYAATKAGEVYDSTAQYEDAIKYYKKALLLPGAKKVYIYKRMARSYMYMGDDRLSTKYQEKAEKMLDDGTSKLIYEFNPDSLNPKFQKKQSKGFRGGLALFIVLISVGAPLIEGIVEVIDSRDEISNLFDDASVYEEEYPVTSDEDYSVAEDNTIDFDEAFDFDAYLMYVDEYSGNANSNSHHGTQIAEFFNDDFYGDTIESDDTGVYHYNPYSETSNLISDIVGANQINVYLDDVFFVDPQTGYIYTYNPYQDEAARLLVTDTHVHNLLVDDTSLYYLTSNESSTQLKYYNYKTGSGGTVLEAPLNTISYLNQSDYRLYFIQDKVIYRGEKTAIIDDSIDLTFEVVPSEFIPTSLTFDMGYLYATGLGELGIYQFMPMNDTVVKLVDFFDFETTDYAVYNGNLYIPEYVDDQPVTHVYDMYDTFMYDIDDFYGNVLITDYIYYSPHAYYDGF